MLRCGWNSISLLCAYLWKKRFNIGFPKIYIYTYILILAFLTWKLLIFLEAFPGFGTTTSTILPFACRKVVVFLDNSAFH